MSRKLFLAVSAGLFLAGFGVGLLLDATRAPLSPTGRPTGRQTGGPESGPAAWDASWGAQPRFADVTQQAGVDFRHENGMTGRYQYLEIMGAGVCMLDYDRDGDLDLYFVNGNKLTGPPDPSITNRFYRNNGDWTFTDVTRAAGVAASAYGQGSCAGDYDNDGDTDLYVSNYGPNVLYRNNGDGTFTDVTASAGVGDAGWGQTCSFLDYDGDGWLDLFVQNYLSYAPSPDVEAFVVVGKRKVPDYPSPLGFRGSPDFLFRNNRDGTFRNVTEQAGLSRPDGKGMGLACADFNDDGRVDIFVANDTQENYLFINRGEGKFEEVGLVWGVAFDGSGVPEASMGVDVGDLDGDNLLDLIVPVLRRQFFTFFRNRGEYFEDVSAKSGLARATASSTGFSANCIDYDNDGDLDLFFTCGGVRMNELASPDGSYNERYGMPDLLVANDGKGRFNDVSAWAGPYFQKAMIGRGSAAGDLDNDGDLDLVICNLADRAVILRNDTPSGHWITLDLLDAASRRNPRGASVLLDAGNRRRRADVHGGITYLSQGDPRVHFGLGASASIDRLEVRWPSGRRQVLERIPADRFLTIEEGK